MNPSLHRFTLKKEFLVKRIHFLLVLFVFAASSAWADCTRQVSTGYGYQQAVTNCRAILQGDVGSCYPGSGGMWTCDCYTGCQQPDPGNGCRVERVSGPSYSAATTNCRAILQGEPYNCQPGSLWTCDCSICH
jgi:hypothetical protein